MPHKIDLVMDFQYGSTGKGLLAGWLAKRGDYDTAVCAFATNAGHTYIDRERGLHIMTQQLPTAICSPTVKTILLGPGALIHPPTFMAELERYHLWANNKRIMIHPHAAVVYDYHMASEHAGGMTKMGSTAKGVGAAMIERIWRKPVGNVAINDGQLRHFCVTPLEYRKAIEGSESLLIEGAQGFSLSIYHGQYPFTTSRDVTPWQIAADCGLSFKDQRTIQVIGTLRTFPIRVSNRDGSSGPCYPDQKELTWDQIGVPPELTTVTKLPRRVFSFSRQQLTEALWHCGSYWQTRLFLNFANYMMPDKVAELIDVIEQPIDEAWNAPKVEWIGNGADDADVQTRAEYDSTEGATCD